MTIVDILAFVIIGVVLGLVLICANDKFVYVEGTKDSFQTVTWKDRTYKLVPLDEKKP